MLKNLKQTILAGAASLALAGTVVLASASPAAAQQFSSGPGEAVSAAPTSDVLDPGASQWYVFTYDHNDGEDAEAIQAFVELTMDVEDSIHFQVWTPENIREWVNGEEVTPVGAGTAADDDVPTVLSWANGTDATETFYIVVENDSAQPAGYTLSVSGEAVSF